MHAAKWHVAVLAVLTGVLAHPDGAWAQGKVYVVGEDMAMNGHVFAFTRTGIFPIEIEVGGIWPVALAVKDPYFLVGDIDSHIRRFSADGTSLGDFAIASDLQGPIGKIEQDSNGNVYVCEMGIGYPNTNCSFDNSGIRIALFSDVALLDPTGIDADASGNVYIANDDPGGAKLFKFSAAGVMQASYSLPEVEMPMDVAIDEQAEDLYVADFAYTGGIVKCYSISTGAPVYSRSISCPTLAFCSGLFFDDVSGHLFVAEWGLSLQGSSAEITLDGELVNRYVHGDLATPEDIVVLPNADSNLPATGPLGLAGCAAIIVLAFRRRSVQEMHYTRNLRS